ncbi:hypothetical protein [Micromonospora siamensis]|uniref:Uncharacterized protein n=1 Tax=Micromonospora siamensis TaxID=299152 RepID=A0A1C5J0K5_9ACTN|nr:hypothetical protein [Micromonospora siamensis]SCG63821.1 hypothetical protein GA0074704_3981 [Micromonospora siamensis]
MRGIHLAGLHDEPPPGVTDALEAVEGVDGVLAHGLARLGEPQLAALTGLAGALTATPLGGRVTEAVEKLSVGSVADEHLAALAGARTALFGAVHDALLARVDGVLGRDRSPWTGPVADAPDQDTANLRAGCRAWLHELAVTGWRGVDQDLVAAADRPVEAALAVPALRRLAVLLDGLAAELRASCPVAVTSRLPARRWADLWSRALLLAQEAAPATPPPVDAVDGRLLPLGVDVHEHGTAVQVQVHAVLEPDGGGPTRLVRATVGAARTDTIVGPALWRLLDAHPVLLTALAQHRALRVTGLPARGGDLIWRDDRATLDEPADPFATARVLLAGARAAPVPPLDRHPAAIAEPVLLEGYAVSTTPTGGTTLTLDGQPLDVAVDRLPGCGPLTPELVVASSACVGLLRWDAGRWSVQPLAVQATVKRKPVEAHNGDWALGVTDPKVAKAEAKAGDAVEVLRERAGRLLRR